MSQERSCISEEIPGCGPKCKDCAGRLDISYPYLNYPCKEVKVTDTDRVFTPEMTVDSEGLFTCNSFKPNISTVLRNLAAKVREFIPSIKASLPL